MINLHAIIDATYKAPHVTPALLVWIEGACCWEIMRRVGSHFELLPPEAAVDVSEDALSIQAANALRASFAGSDLAPAALRFFDVVLLKVLSGGERKH